MRVSTTIEFKNRYVYVRRLEDADLNEIEETWRRIAAACAEHQCYNVLIESFIGKIRMENILPFSEAIAKSGIDHRHRIAWVHHRKESLGDIEKIEARLKEQGVMNGGLFSNIEQALRWLLIAED